MTFATAEAEVPHGGAMLWAESEDDYQKKVAERVAKSATFVPIKRKPKDLGASAHFGVGFEFEGRNLSWVLDGDDKKGFVLYVDLNANGDLSDDPPQRFERGEKGYSCLFRSTARDLKNDPKESYPIVLKLEVELPRENQPRFGLFHHDWTVRRGVAHVATRDVVFSMSGARGLYDLASSVVFFDLDGDGRLDGADPSAMPHDSPERFPVSDKYVTIGETSYEFVVDRYGRNLTLKPLATKTPARPTLLPNSPAPDFSFIGLDGKGHSLSDYRGKVVLLEFWATWCRPCVEAAPKLSEAYEKYRSRGFEIVGVSADDSEEKLREFIIAKKLAWDVGREEQTGPIHRLYRVVLWPSYFLIGKDGTIVATGVGGRDLLAEMEKLVSTEDK